MSCLYKQRPQIKQDFLLKYMGVCEKGISVKGEEAVRYRLIKCHISLYLIMSFHLISSQNEKKIHKEKTVILIEVPQKLRKNKET